MQITFDTSNKLDLALLTKLMDAAGVNSQAAVAADAQPEVAQNTGTTATGSTFRPEGGGVAGAAQEAAPVPVKKGKRVVKEAAAEPLEEVAVAPVEKPSEETPGAPAKDTPTSDKPQTLDEVRAALQQFTAAKGVPAGIELLKEFNAGRISELDASLYSEFVERCAA